MSNLIVAVIIAPKHKHSEEEVTIIRETPKKYLVQLVKKTPLKERLRYGKDGKVLFVEEAHKSFYVSKSSLRKTLKRKLVRFNTGEGFLYLGKTKSEIERLGKPKKK